ncbi:hypothetical protein GCM10020255_069730 [Rhodococcus baikonurensis]
MDRAQDAVPGRYRSQDVGGEDGAGINSDLSRDDLRTALLEDAHAAYKKREAEIDAIAGENGMRELERRVFLSVLDRKWREHLYEMDYLKEESVCVRWPSAIHWSSTSARVTTCSSACSTD